MRSIRRAAIAGATAASLILGAASVATAEENGTQNSQNSKSSEMKAGSSKDKDNKKGEDGEAGKGKVSSAKKSSAEINHQFKLEGNKPANGARLFGSTRDFNKEPRWAKIMAVGTYIGLIGSFLGLVVFPAYNFLLANHMLPGQAPR